MKHGIPVRKKERKMTKKTRNSLIFSGAGLVVSIGVLALAIRSKDAAFCAVAASVTTMYAGLFVFFVKLALNERKEAKVLAI